MLVVSMAEQPRLERCTTTSSNGCNSQTCLKWADMIVGTQCAMGHLIVIYNVELYFSGPGKQYLGMFKLQA